MKQNAVEPVLRSEALGAVRASILQRKCACGQHTGGSACADCSKKKQDAAQSGSGTLQRHTAGIDSPADVANTAPPIVHDVLRSPGQPLDTATRSFFEPRFGYDFSRVRVHADARAAESARAVDALAYTVGSDIVFASSAFAPERPSSRHLLAHELTHILQQSGTEFAAHQPLHVNEPGDSFEMDADRIAKSVLTESTRVNSSPAMSPQSVSNNRPATVQRQPAPATPSPLDDPDRYSKVYESLFVKKPPPSTSPGTPAPAFLKWDASAETAVINDLKAVITKMKADQPGAFQGTIPDITSESAAKSDAVAMDQQVRTRFPQIAVPLSPTVIKSHVSLMTDAITQSDDFLRNLTEDLLSRVETLKKFQPTKTEFDTLVKDILKDPDSGSDIKTLARHKGSFIEESANPHNVFLSPGLDAEQRQASLVHELVHFYAHDLFHEWADSTVEPRIYNEGFTEYLARKAMTSEQLKVNKKSYQDRVDKVEKEVAAFVPEDDIARAYFTGAVWRIEGKSKVAKKAFKEQIGMDPTAKHKQEQEESQTGPGIVEVVAPGERYRFMNLGDEDPQPKQEHLDFFGKIYAQFVAPSPGARLRFVGHASSPGTVAFNDQLSLRRAQAFYQMARDAGVTDAQLLDAAKPPHFGEKVPTAGNEDVRGRAFNRRVELFITSSKSATVAPQPAGGAQQPAPANEDLPKKAPNPTPDTGGSDTLSTQDAGGEGGGGSAPDAGSPDATPVDAGKILDAGTPSPKGDAGPDAGSPDAGSSARPTPAAGVPAAVAAPPAAAGSLSWTQILRSTNDALWFFCGEHPRWISTDTVLQAQNFTDPGQLHWSIKQGADKVGFSGAPTGEKVTVASTAGSVREKDVSIEVREGTGAGANSFTGALTVRKPHRLIMQGAPTDQPGPLPSVGCPPGCASPCGWWTQFGYRIVDNFGGTMNGASVNENFPGGNAKTNDQPNNWPIFPLNGGRTPTGTFKDDWSIGGCAASGASPIPVSPGSPNAGQSVDKYAHEFLIGSETPGKGCRVQKHTVHRYLGFARHEGITTPAP